MKLVTIIFCVLVSVLGGRGAEFDLGTHGSMSITDSDGWSISGKAVTNPDGRPLGYAFAIKPRTDAHAKCLLTFIYTTNGAPNKEALRKEVLRITQRFVSSSVEQKQNLKDLSLETGFGAYCLFTDASLVGKKVKPDDYKVMGSGQVQLTDDMVGVVSLFADEADGAEMKAMLKMINSLKVKPRVAK